MSKWVQRRKKKEVKQIEKMNLDSHIKNECPKRASECELCGEKGTFQHITQVHVKTCSNVVVDCRNVQCNRRLRRCQLDEHVDNECEYTKVLCELCGTYVEKKNLDVHKQSDIHTLYDKEATATAERDELKQQAATATAERDELKQQAATATAERDELKQQAARATADRDKLKREAATATANIKELKQEAAEATANRIELRRLVYWLLTITGVVCAVLVAVALRAPESPPNNSHMTSIKSLKDSLATLEKQVAELKKQSAAKEKASPSVEMVEKVAALEKQLTAMLKVFPEVDEKVAALEKQFTEKVAELEKKLAVTAKEKASPSVEMAEKVAALEKKLTAMKKVSPEIKKIDEKVAELEKKLTTKDGATLYDHDFLQKTIDKKIEDYHLQQREDFIPVCISKKSKPISDPITFGQNKFWIEVSAYVYIKMRASAKSILTGRATVTIVLLNQLEDKNHRFIKSVNFTTRVGYKIPLGKEKKIVHSSSLNIRYINDDGTICFRVLAEEASGAKPWLSGASNMHTNLSVLIITIAVSIMMSIH